MEPAAKILIVGGTFAIAISLLIGVDLARRRRTQSAADSHGWLVAHQTVLMQGFMLLGLSLAALLSTLGRGIESAAAWLIVSAATMSLFGTVTNAAQKTTDQFAQRSLGLRFNTFQSVLLLPGVAILLYGVVRAV